MLNIAQHWAFVRFVIIVSIIDAKEKEKEREKRKRGQDYYKKEARENKSNFKPTVH